jgi:hypothetical protein
MRVYVEFRYLPGSHNANGKEIGYIFGSQEECYLGIPYMPSQPVEKIGGV